MGNYYERIGAGNLSETDYSSAVNAARDEISVPVVSEKTADNEATDHPILDQGYEIGGFQASNENQDMFEEP